MTPRARIILMLLVGLAAMAVLIPLSSRLEQVEEEIPIGLHGEARTNPLLAAQRLFERSGIPAKGFESLSDLPPRDTALLLFGQERSLTRWQIESLTAWIEGGGHLIVGASDDRSDPLFEALGVGILRGPQSEALVALRRAGPRARGSPPAREKPLDRRSTTRIPGSDGSLRVSLPADLTLYAERPGESRSADVAGPELALRRGSGGVSAITDLEFITNGMIGELDHAKMLWRLVTLDRQPAGVWLVRSEAGLPIAALLFRKAWMPILALSLTLLAWAWRKAVRFGPVLPPPPTGSRSLLEHVEAAGNFFWRRGLHEILFARTRSAFELALARRRPYLARVPVAERSTLLASETRLPRKDILSALAAPCPPDPETFTRTIRTLETLRRSM